MYVYLAIFVIFSLLYIVFPTKYRGILLLALVIAVSALAYKMVPNPTDDVLRYYKTIDRLRDGGYSTLQTMIDEGNNNWGALPVCGYYFYFLSLFPNNRYVAAVTVFLAYGAMMFMMYKASKKLKLDKMYTYIGILTIFATYWYYELCGGIRNGLAYSLFSLCIYYELVENKHKKICWVMYILLMFFHSSVAALVLARVLMLVLERMPDKLKPFYIVIVIVSAATYTFVLEFLHQIFPGNSFFELLAGKAESMSGDRSEDNMWLGGTVFMVNTVIVSATAAMCFIGKYLIKHTNNDVLDKYMDYGKILFIYLLISISNNKLLFVRSARLIAPQFLALIFITVMQIRKESEKENETAGGINSVVRNEGRLEVIFNNDLIMDLTYLAFMAINFWYVFAGTSIRYLRLG